MAKEKLEILSIDELNKKKKWSLILLYILIGAAVLNIIILVTQLTSGTKISLELLGPVFGCLAIGIIFYGGIRKIDEELHKRENK